jgi:hypothetical protein
MPKSAQEFRRSEQARSSRQGFGNAASRESRTGPDAEPSASTPPPFETPFQPVDPETLSSALATIGDDEFWITQGVEYSSHAAGLFAYGTLVGIAARMRASPVAVMTSAIALNPLQLQLESPEEATERRRLMTVRALGSVLSEEELQTLAQQEGNPISDHLKRQAALPASEESEPDPVSEGSGAHAAVEPSGGPNTTTIVSALEGSEDEEFDDNDSGGKPSDGTAEPADTTEPTPT